MMWNPFKKKVVVNKIEPDFADVSHWEKVDFEKYDKKILITKATEAESYIDPTFKDIKNKCKEKGITFGAYHFFRCDKNPLIQASHYLNVIGNTDMMPILDIETADGISPLVIHLKIKVWLDEVERVTGKIPMIYSGHSFILSMCLGQEFARYPLWLARYTDKTPSAPFPWKEWTIWQFSDKAEFKGIGQCDGNIYNKKVLIPQEGQ